jgi:uncharacterized membrane protein YhaH (DUF805 family)
MPTPGMSYALLQDVGDMAGYGFGMGTWVVIIALIVFQLAAWWKTFEKAGQPGWASLIPIYNIYVLLRIGGKPGWWLLLMLIPFVNIIVAIMMSVGVANNFGKGGLFGLGLLLLGFIFYPILGFGDAEYQPSS